MLLSSRLFAFKASILDWISFLRRLVLSSSRDATIVGGSKALWLCLSMGWLAERYFGSDNEEWWEEGAGDGRSADFTGVFVIATRSSGGSILRLSEASLRVECNILGPWASSLYCLICMIFFLSDEIKFYVVAQSRWNESAPATKSLSSLKPNLSNVTSVDPAKKCRK